LKLAQQGNRGAQNDIGIMYAEGRGVKQDNAEAVKWFQKSAEQGHVLGACNLALHVD
jgi:TPR repeat protein